MSINIERKQLIEQRNFSFTLTDKTKCCNKAQIREGIKGTSDIVSEIVLKANLNWYRQRGHVQ